MNRRTFLKTATGAIVAAVVVDAIGDAASFIPDGQQFYTVQVWMESNALVMLRSVEHLAVGDAVTSNGDGFVRKLRSEDELIIGFAAAMKEIAC